MDMVTAYYAFPKGRAFSYNHFDLNTLYEYHSCVLADLDDDELQASDNPVDLAFYAAKCALRADDELQKYTYLRKLTALLTERGWDANEKRNLLLFMRRVINLQDEALQEQYTEYNLELRREGNSMYDWMKEAEKRIVERHGIEKGREEGIEKMVKSLLAKGISPDVIAQSAEWPVERVRTFAN